MIPFILRYWKPLSIAAAFLMTFYAGYHVRGSFDQAAADALLQKQREATEEAQDALNTKAKELEATLANERAKTAELQRKWRKAHAKDHVVCKLPDTAVGLLKDGTAKDTNPR